MKQASIVEEHLEQQPVLTTPYEEPSRHWKTTGTATHNEIVDERRLAEQPLPTSWDSQLAIDAPDDSPINRLRDDLHHWRTDGYEGATTATRRLLEYWSRPSGEGAMYSLFYAQREAVETVIYLTERGNGRHWMTKRLKALGEDYSRGLVRLALRMATGTGKTLVMACLIAWYAVNRKREHRADPRGLARNVDRVVVLCPGRTIKDRLAPLVPNTGDNIYDEWSLVPDDLRPRLNGFQVDVLNWEKLQPLKDVEFQAFGADKKAKVLAAAEDPVDETPHEMWSRLLGRSTSDRERVVAFNDEGHHCWDRADGTGVWANALHALAEHPRYDFRQALDFSATPLFIASSKALAPKGARPRNGALLPWIVSEFALMEAMEAGLVKIPQPPMGDSETAETYRHLFEANGKKKLTSGDMGLVRDAADMLYRDYEETFDRWKNNPGLDIGHPVFIVVANTKANAEAIFHMLGGAPEAISAYPLFRNSHDDERTILVLSKTTMSETAADESPKDSMLGFRKVGSKDATEDELRDVLRNVARPGTAGEQVRCVVSVGMLTEGWDCQRVTHILGYRAFGSQLLCEQTVGRALRRQDYDNRQTVRLRGTDETHECYIPEYATVLGVPFDHKFMSSHRHEPTDPSAFTEVNPRDKPHPYRIEVPDFTGYIVLSQGTRVSLKREAVQSIEIGVPIKHGTSVVLPVQGPIGLPKTLKPGKNRDTTSGAWRLAAELATLLARNEEQQGDKSPRRAILFAGCLKAVREWLRHPNVAITEDVLAGHERAFAEHAILPAIAVDDVPTKKAGIPRQSDSETRSASDWKSFKTALNDIATVKRSELDKAACHSKLETRIARALDKCPQVAAHTRNHGRERIEIPYRDGGAWRVYVPDFFVRCVERKGVTTHIVIEGKGLPDESSRLKRRWTENWWIPCANAVNGNHRWTYREIGMSDDVAKAVRSAIEETR